MQAVSRHSAAQSGIEADWQTETLITVGATEALTSAFMGLLNEGDEVLPICLSCMEPELSTLSSLHRDW